MKILILGNSHVGDLKGFENDLVLSRLKLNLLFGNTSERFHYFKLENKTSRFQNLL